MDCSLHWGVGLSRFNGGMAGYVELGQDGAVLKRHEESSVRKVVVQPRREGDRVTGDGGVDRELGQQCSVQVGRDPRATRGL